MGALAALDGVGPGGGAGEFVALVGGSGSGKTTLLKTINRLIVPTPAASRSRARTSPPRAAPAAPPHRLRLPGGGLFPHLQRGREHRRHAEAAGLGPAAHRRRVDALLDLVALPREVAARAPAAPSGGQRQRVGVARALAAEPS
jgi:osmoprotectant transport system ATP-binding protein